MPLKIRTVEEIQASLTHPRHTKFLRSFTRGANSWMWGKITDAEFNPHVFELRRRMLKAAFGGAALAGKHRKALIAVIENKSVVIGKKE